MPKSAAARAASDSTTLEDLLHPSSRAHLGDPDGVLSDAAHRVHMSCAALRALADLTAGESAETTRQSLREVCREDLGALLTIIQQHLAPCVSAIDVAASASGTQPH